MGLFRKKVEEPKIEMPMATYCKWNKTLNTVVKMVQGYEKRLNCPTLTDVRPDLDIIQIPNSDFQGQI